MISIILVFAFLWAIKTQQYDVHIHGLSKKVSSSESAIESLEHDLHIDIDNRLLDFSQTMKHLESSIESLKLEIADLNSGITKKITDIIDNLYNRFFAKGHIEKKLI